MGKLAFVFSGQGAQFPGMGTELAAASPAAAAIFAMADRIRPGTSAQCASATKEELSTTVNTQPCLFCADLMAAEALREAGVVPDCLAGFSLGEIPALAFGGYLSYEDAFRFVVKRGEYMDLCAKEAPGAMYAVVKLTNEQVEAICHGVEGAYPVNYNCKGQVVAACREEVGEALVAAVKAEKGKAIKLAVSGAFHSPMMDGASRRLAEEFAGLSFESPRYPVYANATAAPYTGKELLFKQVNSPVLWQKTIEEMAAAGVDTFVEVGAGKTLCGLVAKICPEATALSVQDAESLQNTLEVLKDVR